MTHKEFENSFNHLSSDVTDYIRQFVGTKDITFELFTSSIWSYLFRIGRASWGFQHKVSELMSSMDTDKTRSLDEYVLELRNMLFKKGHDYANEDAMSNFKNIGKMTNLEPDKVILVFAASKISRTENLISSGKTPQNESVYDSIVDLACYGFLLNAINTEKNASK